MNCGLNIFLSGNPPVSHSHGGGRTWRPTLSQATHGGNFTVVVGVRVVVVVGVVVVVVVVGVVVVVVVVDIVDSVVVVVLVVGLVVVSSEDGASELELSGASELELSGASELELSEANDDGVSVLKSPVVDDKSLEVELSGSEVKEGSEVNEISEVELSGFEETEDSGTELVMLDPSTNEEDVSSVIELGTEDGVEGSGLEVSTNGEDVDSGLDAVDDPSWELELETTDVGSI